MVPNHPLKNRNERVALRLLITEIKGFIMYWVTGAEGWEVWPFHERTPN